MIHQLRVYEIFEHNKAAFFARFRDHAARIMATYGFEILWMWESSTPERAEFTYLLAWPDEETMLRSWEAFKADEEWKEIKRATNAEHGDLVGAIEERTMVTAFGHRGYRPRTSAAREKYRPRVAADVRRNGPIMLPEGTLTLCRSP